MKEFVEAMFDQEQVEALPAAAKEMLKDCKVYKNDVYQVVVRDPEHSGDWPEMVHLSVKRIDREPIHDWRDLQEIKNMLVGDKNEGVELYPSEARMVDSANQYHLWVFKEPSMVFPFGFVSRFVKDSGELEEVYSSAKQRPFKQ